MDSIAAAVGQATDKALGQAVTKTQARTAESTKSSAPDRDAPEPYGDLDKSQVSQKLFDEAKRVAASSAWPIYLFGPPGRGKSYGMAALFVLWKGQNPLWHDVSALLRKIMRCRMSDDGFVWESRPGGQSAQVFESKLMEQIRDASLVCFDDVGLRSASDAMYDAFYEIVNHRRGKPTIFTGNLAPKELKEVYDGRIASRILSGTWIELAGEDRRLKQTRYVKIEGAK